MSMIRVQVHEAGVNTKPDNLHQIDLVTIISNKHQTASILATEKFPRSSLHIHLYLLLHLSSICAAPSGTAFLSEKR